MRVLASVLPFVASLATTSLAAPASNSIVDVDISIGNGTHKPELRILPLGASIVFGMGTSAGNSFRLPLREQLVSDGYEVDMVGSRSCGNMEDNQCEATSGQILTEIHAASKRSYKYKPNLVLMNAGTNDIVRSIDVRNADERLEAIIEDLWTNVSNETVIVVSTLLPIKNAVAERNRAIVNRAYRKLVESLFAEGKPIYLADMDKSGITVDDLPDGTHPDLEGAELMAKTFYRALRVPLKDGTIKDPIE